MRRRTTRLSASSQSGPCAPEGADYEVGYKRPPKHSQFQSGQSGNPKGRPARSKSFKPLIEDELGAKVTIREGGRQMVITKRELVVKQLVKRAIEGDHRSQQTLLKFDLELTAIGRSATGDAPPAEAPLEQDDRAIIDAFAAMLKDAAADGATRRAGRTKSGHRHRDDDDAEEEL